MALPKITTPLRSATKWALFMGLYSCLPLLVVRYDLVRFPGLLSGASAVLSFAIALLIGFRVNAAYDRWWEARKLWELWSISVATWPSRCASCRGPTKPSASTSGTSSWLSVLV